jgi:hypothetical protein
VRQRGKERLVQDTRNQGEPPSANEVLAEVNRRFSGNPEDGALVKPEAGTADRKWYQVW